MNSSRQEFFDKVKSVISTYVSEVNEKSSKLSVECKLALSKDNEGKNYIINSNESFSLTGSNVVVAKINEYLRMQNVGFDQYLADGETFVVDLVFSAKVNNMADEQNNPQDVSIEYVPEQPKYNFDQIIMSENLKSEILEGIALIENKDLIYKVWGFGKMDPSPKSVLLFYGEPGTGKTMCAHAIANKFGKTLLAPKFSEIESKYLGDSGKNLKKLFQTATKENSVLFFDEADSFLGKRVTNISQSSDQALNSLRSQMLIELENFSGIVIFATNLASNIDQAFESRILKHLQFEKPNLEARVLILKKMIPENLPWKEKLSDEQYFALAEILDGLAGREIKNAVLNTLLKKASEFGDKALFTFEDFKLSFENHIEMLKQLAEEKERALKLKIANAIKKGNVKVSEEPQEPQTEK